jgi:hypothetical protein
VWDAVITECLQMALPRRKLLVRFGGEKPTFIAASVVLLLTPGPAVLYIVARSVECLVAERCWDRVRWAISSAATDASFAFSVGSPAPRSLASGSPPPW